MRIALLFISVILFQCSVAQQSNCQSERYLKRIFPSVTKTSQVYYGTSDPYGALNQAQDLYMDIYEPTGDTLKNRPVIVYAFGGAFLIGDKNQPPIPTYCETFAQMGYVVVAIDYRIGFNVLSTESAVRAVYRAAQDLRAAVRYLCQRNQQYRIDTASVILTGSSAGCFAGLHSTYFEESQRPVSTFGIPLEPADLGCFDCSGNTDFGKRLPKIRAIVNHWGALLDTLLIQNEPDENCPVISIHGDGDALVPYGNGNPFSYPVFPNVYGSKPIHQRLTNLGIKNQLVTLIGEGHEPWLVNTALLDSAYKYTAPFLHEALMPAPQIITTDSFACKGAVITARAIQRDRSAYCWSLQGNATIIAQGGHEITFQCNDAGNVKLTLVEKNYLDVVSVPVDFTVSVLPRPKAEFAITSVNQLAITLSDLSQYNSTKTWVWGNGNSTSGQSATYTYAAPGSYTLTQIVANKACSDTFSRIVEVDTCPVAAFNYDVQGDSLILVADSSNAINFSWNVSGTTTQGQTAVVFLPNKGTVAVTLNVTNKIGCSRSVVQFVNNNVSGGLIDMNATLTPSVYPNPFATELIINLNQPVKATYKLIDMIGAIKMEGQFIGSSLLSPTHHLPAGMYILLLEVQGETYNYRLVRQ